MRKPDTDPDNVQMSDVLCDFCHREWTDDVPMIEGHQGSCVCGRCLSVAYAEVVQHAGEAPTTREWQCRLCLETESDRAALNRAGEAAWQSPVDETAFLCRRCIKQAAGVLHSNANVDWHKPVDGQ